MNKFFYQKGMGLVEVILAIALFGIFATALIGLLVNSYDSNVQAEQKDKATLYAQQGMEAVWSIRRQAWNLLEEGDHGVVTTSGYWEFSGTSDLLEDKYTRVVNIADACRSGASIVDCPSGTVDPHTKKVSSTVTYVSVNGIENQIVLDSYLTIWQSKDFIQTDWSGGSGQANLVDMTKYYSDDGNIDYSTSGEIKLASSGAGSCGVKTWPFTTAENYTYDPLKIEITGGIGQLINFGGGSSGSTVNPSFDTNSASWTYNDWNQNGGEVNVIGARQSSGGNPNGYVNVYFPSGKNDELGGYWEQAFDTTVNSPTATVDFDWLVSQYDPTPNTFQLYVFVDSSSGVPSIGQEIWSSGEITSTQGWTAQTNIDISSKIATSGTYYLKIAVWVETDGGANDGPYEIGYDNVQLNWFDAGSYSIDNPTIRPTVAHVVSNIDAWSAFTEVAMKDGGEIYYQLSGDNGTIWQYWNGTSWATAGAANYNTASVINSNISTFSTSTSQIVFKAFLESDGAQLVQLDEVRIGCSQYYDWPFSSGANYTYDSNDIEVTADVAQLVDLGGGGSCSGTATACSVYSDQNSCEGQGGCLWLGGSSGGTTNPDFDAGDTGWSYNDWDQDFGEENVNGGRAGVGGNPNGWAYITFPAGKNDEFGGYGYQAFTTTADNPIVTINFDWQVYEYENTPNTFQLYVFVDSDVGEPIIGEEVWSSGEQTSTQNWTSAINIDASSRVGTAGTYYLKIAVWLETDGGDNDGPYTVGYDNVQLEWTGAGSCLSTATSCNTFSNQTSCEGQDGCTWAGGSLYSTSNPPIYPINSYNASGVSEWSLFTETANKNGGEIYYQLSDDNGSSWQYWNGSSWATAGTANYNTATVVNTNIADFSTSTAQIAFKAFLESDGTQLVQLDNIRIGWGEIVGSGYATSGWFESSAFDTASSSAFTFLSWLETLPSANEDIQCQIATAPDASGSPGTWTVWLGPTGAGTYYTNGDKILFPLSNGHNDDQWIKYKIFLSGDGTDTPILEEIKINYTP